MNKTKVVVIYDRIEQVRKQRNIPKMEFYDRIDMTPKGYSQMVENNSIKVATLQKIAAVLEVPITTFFEQAQDTDNAMAQPLHIGTEPPINLAAIKGIMALNIPIEEKAQLLQDTVELLCTTIAALKTTLTAQAAEIQKLQGKESD